MNYVQKINIGVIDLSFHRVTASLVANILKGKGRSGYIEDKIANKHGDWYMYDLGLMTQNLCLAAHSLGLGTVVVGWYDLEEAERILNCPEDVQVVTLIPAGYRAQKGHVPTHRPIAEFVHINTF